MEDATTTFGERQAVHPTGSALLLLGFQTLGVIYGDIGTSPLYTVQAIFPYDPNNLPSEEDVIGAISAIIWALAIVPLLKYCIFVLRFGFRTGEGGTFAVYCGLYPPPAGEEHDLLLTETVYDNKDQVEKLRGSPLHIYKSIKWTLLLWTLSDGVLTPAVSIVSAVVGIGVAQPSVVNSVVPISIGIIVVLFLAQMMGTHRISLLFAPVVFVWFLLIGGGGIYNITRHPGILRAFDISRAVAYFVRTGSFDTLTGVILAITGVEALFANLGQFSRLSIQLTFGCFIFPCLILAYLGQGARLIADGQDVFANIFYLTIPGPTGGGLYWLTFTAAVLATIIASQAMISGCFSLIQQLIGWRCFPPLKIVHTSDKMEGQIYIPIVNFVLMILVIVVTATFQTSVNLTNAYGFAVATVMITTTSLVSLQIHYVKGYSVIFGIAFFVFFTFIDALFWGASLKKVPEGAWLPLSMGVALTLLMVLWTWAKDLEQRFDLAKRLKLREVFAPTESSSFNLEKNSPAASNEHFKGRAEGTQDDDGIESNLSQVPHLGPGGEADPPRRELKSGDLILALPPGPLPLARLPSLAIFQTPIVGAKGANTGAPYSFVTFIRHHPALPRIVVFFAIRKVAVARVAEEDQYVVNKVRRYEGFYTATLRLGFRDKVDLTKASSIISSKVVALEKQVAATSPDVAETLEEIERASTISTHFLTNYYVRSGKVGSLSAGDGIVKKYSLVCLNFFRRFLLEQIYRRLDVNFPEEVDYEFAPDSLIRIGVDAVL